MGNAIISPIFYMGNKKKLINKGLIDLFPKNIDTFYDLCAGSAIVSMNVVANRYVVNDIDKNLQVLYKIFKYKSHNQIIFHICSRVEDYGLSKEGTKRNQFFDKVKLKQYKDSYLALRDHYNHDIYSEDERMLDFYTLMFYSFSQQFRFNSKGEFNMPVGNNYFSERNKQYIKDGCKFFSSDNVSISCFDFCSLAISKLQLNDFVYLDPPYLGTVATYNENNAWNIKNEEQLYDFCEKLNGLGIKFGLSNIFQNKGNENTTLIQWCEKCNWNVYTFDNFTYMACGKGNSQAKEVYICNY